MGLFTGMSILSIFEILMLLLRGCTGWIWFHKERRAQRKRLQEKEEGYL